MYRTIFLHFILIILTGLLAALPAGPLGAQSSLAKVFNDPPAEAKPRGYWLWAHGNYDYSRIRTELKAFKEMGIGGVDIFDMGVADRRDIIPPGNPFMGPRMLDGLAFALQEAQKLDLPVGLSVSNGWNAGGDWTLPDEMIMRLLFWKDTLQGPLKIREIGFPEVPRSFKKPYGTFELFPLINEDGFPAYYEDVALVAYPLTEDGLITDLEQIVYFDAESIAGNQVDLELPAGAWVLARAVVTPLGQKMWMRSDNSTGFIMDHYSRKATRHHFEHIIGKLEARLGDLRQTALERLYLCSFEAEDYIIWSPELKEEFFRQHGYTLDPYIPVFAGQEVLDAETSRRFLHDYRVTVSEMFVNNHYRQARDICHDHGLLLASESGGPGPPLHYVPTEDLKALGAVDVMRGEFWHKKSEYFDEHGNDLLQVVKNIASAAHIYGRKVVEMESFTSHGKHWQEGPLELKRLADRAFCEGMTRVVYHTMPHSPKEAGVPGWSYQAGTHISPRMTWWDLSRPFHQYLARTSALLQTGHFVADVAYYYGEQIPKFASGSKYIRPGLGPGYDYDDLNKEVLLQSTVAEDGRLELPSGMKYRLLVLPDDQEMSLEVLEKIESLLRNGATILGKPPQTVPGLADYRAREARLRARAKQLWGEEIAARQVRRIGRGKLLTGYTEREILRELSAGPDFSYQAENGVRLDYIHRSSPEGEVYFIRNQDSLAFAGTVSFRISERQPYCFDPVAGRITRLSLYTDEAGTTRMPLELPAWGSTFIVFEGEAQKSRQVVAINRNGQALFPEGTTSGIQVWQQDEERLAFRAGRGGNYQFTFRDGSRQTLIYPEAGDGLSIEGPWQVHFPHGWGFDPIQQFERLIDWREHPDPELTIFSGTGTYHTRFSLEPGFLQQDRRYRLRLGSVGEVARIYLNGREIGTSVFPPHSFELDDVLREGENFLTVEVANTWLNQLVGEADKPFDQQRTRSNLGTGTGQPAQRPWSGYEPLPSGLMGPVRLSIIPELTIEPNK